MDEPATEAQTDEATNVFHWRVRRCIELGFTLRQARQIANGPSGWHEAEDLLADGCAPELAVRILS